MTGWVIWSRSRKAWLRQDAMSWTTDRNEAGSWGEIGAQERADNLPLEDQAISYPERVG